MPVDGLLSKRSQVKPRGIPRLDWRHPLAQGLVFYGFDAGNGLILDLVSGRPASFVGTKPGIAPGQFGQGLLWNGSASASFAQDAAIEVVTATGFYTYACAYVQTGAVSAYCTVFGRTANNGLGGPYSNWAFQIDPGGAGQNTALAQFNNAGNVADTSNWTGNANQAFTTLVGVGRSTSLALYAQGKLITTTTGVTLQSYNTNGNTIFSGADTAAAYLPFVGFIPYGAFWSRALTPGEIAALHAAPYSFLSFPNEYVSNALRGAFGSTPVSADSGCRMEALSGLSSDCGSIVEFVRAQRVDVTARSEILATQRSDRTMPVEFIGGTGTALSSDASAPIEALASTHNDSGPAIEAGALVLNDVRGKAELVLVVTKGLGSLAELTAALRTDPSLRLELAATARTDSGMSAEWSGGLFVTGNAVVPLEGAASARRGTSATAESNALLLAEARGAVEWLTAGRAGAAVTDEMLAALLREASGSFEWLAIGTTIIGDAMLPLEWQGTSPAVLLSLESGPGRIRLLATPGRVRRLRRN